MIAATVPAALPGRLAIIDMARGSGIVLMFVYHFSWDLTFFGFAELPLFTNAWWLAFRTLIVGIFLSVAGLSQILAHVRGFRPRPFLRRLGVVGACAGAVTVATALIFPEGYVFFGILHNLALAAVLVPAFAPLPVAAIGALALAFLAAPWLLADPLFDHPWLQWVGLMTHQADSVDYVPLFPWFGVVLLGVAAGRLVMRGNRAVAAAAAWRPEGRVVALLGWLGRHSLALYLVHQPVFFALLYAVAYLAQAGAPVAR